MLEKLELNLERIEIQIYRVLSLLIGEESKFDVVMSDLLMEGIEFFCEKEELKESVELVENLMLEFEGDLGFCCE